MHPLTRFFNYLKPKDFSMALAREHISARDLTEWYSGWMYELMETDEVRNQPYPAGTLRSSCPRPGRRHWKFRGDDPVH
jgi:hypothetical protein